MESYTIAQAAKLLGLSKMGVRFRLNSLNVQLEKDDRGRVVVPENVFRMIHDGAKPESGPESEVESKSESTFHFPESKVESGEELSEKPESKPESDRKAESDPLASMLSVLREQLAVKDAQIAEKDRQIAQLSAQLSDTTEALKAAQRAQEAAQALHAGTMAQLQEVTKNAPVEAEPVAEDEDPEEAEQRRRGFWSWILRGKRG